MRSTFAHMRGSQASQRDAPPDFRQRSRPRSLPAMFTQGAAARTRGVGPKTIGGSLAAASGPVTCNRSLDAAADCNIHVNQIDIIFLSCQSYCR